MESISAVIITDKELDNHKEAATSRLFSFTFRAPGKKEEKPAEGSAVLGGRRFAYRPVQNLDGAVTATAAAPGKFSLADRINSVDAKDDLYTDAEHHVLRVLRRGLQVGLQIHEYYAQASGLERLKAANKANELPKSQEAELVQKGETGAAVGLFASAAFVVRSLAHYMEEQVEALSFDVSDPDVVAVDNQQNAINSALYYVYEELGTHAKDDASLVRTVLLCARALALRIQTMKDSLNHVDFYVRYHYRIDPDDIVISGFELHDGVSGSQVEVIEKRPEEVVGNHIAKFECMRLAQRVVCYDRGRQRNPFVDLGGFSFTFIGDGSPGTGKTTLIQMTVSQLRAYCATLDLPFRYLNFSIDEISDYQGRSGQNAKRFCRQVLDPKVIGFGTIDDVDQVCGNRNDKNASAGQLEVTAVFMQEFAGPNTVVRGNCTFGLFSNYPEKVDDALRQRTQARFLVNGPQTLEDFTDLFYLLLGDNWKLPLGSGYQPYVTQEIKKIIQSKYAEHSRPKSPEIVTLFDRAGRGGKMSTWWEFGEYLHGLQQYDARFTGRAVKNIAEAVRFRMMDFDLPPEWFEDTKCFFEKPYDTKVSMLKELRGTITPEMVIQEINRYADSEARYTQTAKDRELDDRTRQIVLDARARVKAAREIES